MAGKRKRKAQAGRKRRKNRYIDYDYEALYSQSVEDWDEYLIEQLLKEGKVKSVYATKEVYAGDQLEIEIYPEFTKQQAAAEGIEPVKKAEQRAAQKKLNSKNSRKQFWRLAEHNFTNADYWLTLTYAGEQPEFEEAQKCIQRYLRNINGKRKRRGYANAKYLYVTETVSEEGQPVRAHHHLFLQGDCLTLDEVNAMWKYGQRNELRKIEKDENGIRGAAAYMVKEKQDTTRKKYQKRWNGSANLEKPPEKKHHQTKQKTVNQMVKDRDYIRRYTETQKRYAGYIYTNAEIYFNDWNARYYIRVRMRKGRLKDGKEEKAGGGTVHSR
ncbi:hypothetical protein [Phascolarctobacterium sp.]|uniref:rolling circle replication-associated protein n=1 Tax=Phascolarctobacterium sp. TaxID=2049039 RepID=UPI003868DFF2